METAQLIQRFTKRIDRLEQLIIDQKKEQERWAGPSWVTKLTGWNKKELQSAREQNLIDYKRSEGGGWLYNINSIPKAFIKSV